VRHWSPLNVWICRESRAGMPSAIIHSTRVRGSRVALSMVRSGLGVFEKAGESRTCPARWSSACSAMKARAKS
jgi:hypothetical protein